MIKKSGKSRSKHFPKWKSSIRSHPLVPYWKLGARRGQVKKRATSVRGSVHRIRILKLCRDGRCKKYAKIDIRQGIAPQDLNQWWGSKFDVTAEGHLMYSLPRGDCCWGCRVVEHGTSLVCGGNCGSFCSGKSRSRAHKAGIEQGCAVQRWMLRMAV